ncbi:hypothetical protein B0H15DRAFT_493666 [Mycena belliarum]|uniref:Transmembrane protein n=1 Tax=Mycena belliarum TaxID=1033014 RepID=A0AAD6XJU3_9AGAR|nr:hypothetical protein B0H15DRAFT_493666 [Mycena belliae]
MLPIGRATSPAWIAITLAGTWSNTAFFTIEFITAIIYMRNWDPRKPYKCWVYAMLLVDSFASFAVFANAFQALVYSPPNVPWPISMGIISNGLSTFVGQSFLIHLHWLITKKSLVSGFLMFLAVANLMTSLAIAIKTTLNLNLALSRGRTAAPTASLYHPIHLGSAILVASTNTSIAVALASPTWSTMPFAPRFRKRLQTVCTNALSSGALVAVVTLLAMALLLSRKADMALAFLATFICRLYSLTVLVNLIVRSRYFKAREAADHGRRQSAAGDGAIVTFTSAQSRRSHGASESPLPLGTMGNTESSDGPSDTYESDGKTDLHSVLPLGLPKS